jgi:hypothetical protein
MLCKLLCYEDIHINISCILLKFYHLVSLMQVFWPSTVMKKWLNIKQKVYDFSEDEADTETESEDDGIYASLCTIYSYFCLE